jgi:hypothetical protein
MNSMFRAFVPVIAITGLLALQPVHAASPEQWQAASNTATAITGNVTFSADQIKFQNGKSLPLTPAGTIRGFLTNGQKVNATLFRVTRPDDPVLLGGNRLCGGKTPEPVTFIALWKHAPFGGDIDPRDIAVFSGSAAPTDDKGVCATYSYEAGGRH